MLWVFFPLNLVGFKKKALRSNYTSHAQSGNQSWKHTLGLNKSPPWEGISSRAKWWIKAEEAPASNLESSHSFPKELLHVWTLGSNRFSYWKWYSSKTNCVHLQTIPAAMGEDTRSSLVLFSDSEHILYNIQRNGNDSSLLLQKKSFSSISLGIIHSQTTELASASATADLRALRDSLGY